MPHSEPHVELIFKVTGQQIPVDHGYSLYGAISRVFPRFHEDSAVGLKRIRGRYAGDGSLDISPASELVIRMPVGAIGDYLALAGQTLTVDEAPLSVGAPRTRALTPAVALYAHLVTTKNGLDQARFESEIARQLTEMGVQGRFAVGDRKTFAIHGRQIVGYAVSVFELTAGESIMVQERGLGGRRKMGCGFFEPVRS